MLNRRAATLVELLVALVLGAVVLGAATLSVLRQQRTHARIANVASSDAQLRSATGMLAGQLAFIDAAAGDIAPGEARDTAVQLRASITSALACDRGINGVTFLPDPSGAVALGGSASDPRVGDSLWFLGDSTWRGVRISGVAAVTVACPSPFANKGPSLRLTLSGSTDTIMAGAPLRVTRPIRYAFYRASDGTWQLGFREWSEPTTSFAAPQPVAGPFVRQGSGRQTRLRYFASGGEELVGAVSERSAARIRVVTFASLTAWEAGQDSLRSDSVEVALQHATTP